MKIRKVLQSLNVCLNNAISFFNKKIINHSQTFDYTLETKVQRGIPTMEGMGANLIKHILDAEKAPVAMHDIKIKLSSNLHSYLVEQGYVPDKTNKRIKLEMNNTHYTTVKFSIYPKTISIDIGCSDEPITYLPAGATRLASLMAESHHFLCAQSSHKAEIDEMGKWESFHYHKNQDGKITYEGEGFHILLEDALGGVIRAYSKTFSDGSTFVRIEEIIREKILITKLLKNMRHVNTDATLSHHYE